MGQFVFVQGLAMAYYPGGHDWDRRTPGYDFWRNTLSDLGKTVAVNGQPNPLSRASRISTTVFLLTSMGTMWQVLPALFPDRQPLGRGVRVLGMLSLLGMIGLGLTPADRHPVGHAVANGMAAVPGLVAFLLACWGLSDSPRCPRVLFLLSLVFLSFGGVHFGQYVAHFWMGRAWLPSAPLMQRLAFLAGMAWMLLATGTLWREAKKNRSPRGSAWENSFSLRND